MNPTQVKNLLKSLGAKNFQILYGYAKALIGQNLCGLTPIAEGCATTVNNVFAGAFDAPIGGEASTALLYQALKNDVRFTIEQTPQVGDIIISPTGMGTNPDMPHGHVGIVSDGGLVMSNNSLTGIFDEHLSLVDWQNRYFSVGHYPVFYFRLNG